ncbi:hypothetical protein LI328DRAFT_126269 [Trichoderma asperelloides]|nr:hypothetical protein LI328DRAFT_126269 [Trichoderma asperelloides]
MLPIYFLFFLSFFFFWVSIHKRYSQTRGPSFDSSSLIPNSSMTNMHMHRECVRVPPSLGVFYVYGSVQKEQLLRCYSPVLKRLSGDPAHSVLAVEFGISGGL